MRPRIFLPLFSLLLTPLFSLAWVPKPVADDPLVRMPGTQPGEVIDLEVDKNCLSCHGGFEMDHWRGSMMSQASRDPLFWAGMTVAAQDAVWAVGTPNAADICLRCHFPQGWLDGRSDPPNATLMRGEDYDGVSCKICHYMYDPNFKAVYNGTREGTDWLNHWDETGASSTPSQAAANATYAADAAAAATILHFNGTQFFTNNAPKSAAYIENGGGQIYLVTDDYSRSRFTDAKRAPFSDANAKHNILYSRYHKSRDLCGTCHDVSNPVLANLPYATNAPGDGVTVLTTEALPAHAYAHVERTFSEFMLSAFSTNGGIAGTGPYSPDRFNTSRAGNKIANCQDCHFQDIDGIKAGNAGVTRPNESVEHPQSGVPEHRMIGGNAWIPTILASIVGDANSNPNFDATNSALLRQGPAILTLDLSQGELLDQNLLMQTATLAQKMVQDCVSMTNANYNISTGDFSLRIQNHTPHKILSGYPEGRRAFLNVKAYANNTLIYELNPYDYDVGTLKGLHHDYSPNSPSLASWEKHEDALVYEVHQSSSILGVNETFHMALATGRYKDNRIPPRGFDIGNATNRLCEPVWHGVSDLNYFTPDEYAGGYDDLIITLPVGTERIEAGLYYQTTSREFIEFLRDEINGTAATLTGTGAGGDPAYIAQTDPWFSGLAAWGDTIWQLWEHNKNVHGAIPVLMTNTFVQLDVSDIDGDGIPAYWETLHFGGATNAVATEDSDGDSADNLSEYIAFTSPTDSNSVFSFTADITPAGSNTEIAVEFDSLASRFYSLQSTTNLLSTNAWINLTGDFRGIDEKLSVASTNDQPQSFYRINVKTPGSP